MIVVVGIPLLDVLQFEMLATGDERLLNALEGGKGQERHLARLGQPDADVATATGRNLPDALAGQRDGCWFPWKQ